MSLTPTSWSLPRMYSITVTVICFSFRSPTDARRSPRVVRSGWSNHLEHGVGADLGVARWPAGAEDRVGCGGVVDTVCQQGSVDVDGDHFAEHEPRVHGRTVG